MTKVLVVDDEWDIRELLVDTILDAGLDVIEAGDGNAALDRIASDKPDIVLLDIWMPGMDGLQVLERLREVPETELLPVILLTAMPASTGEQTGLKMGVTHYITKPWEPGMIETTIRVALREAGLKMTGSESEDASADAFGVDGTNINVNADHANQISTTGALARLRSGRKKKNTVLNDDGEEVEVITTAEKLPALEQKMGGGLPLGTVNISVGAAASGKSVLCQHLAWGALQGDYGVAYFTSETSPDGLATQMASLGMDIFQYMRTNKLTVYQVPEPSEGEDAATVLNELSHAIERLSRGAQLVIIDTITDLAGSCPEQAVIGFFSACRRMGNQGRTIFVSVHTYAFGSEMFTRLRTLCDGYFTLGSDQIMGKSVRILEVNKINTTEMGRENMVSFVVEPEVGMRLIPLNRSRA